MNEELVQWNKKILIEGIFASKFLDANDLESKTKELEAMEQKKKKIIQSYKTKEDPYKEKWIQLDSEQKLNRHDGDTTLEQYTTYKHIYDKKYDLMKEYLSVIEARYDSELYFYLIRKI